LYTLLIYISANSMDHIPWKTDSRSAGHEISHLLWKAKVHYRMHKSPTLVLTIHKLII
jgi:hypothetical protein